MESNMYSDLHILFSVLCTMFSGSYLTCILYYVACCLFPPYNGLAPHACKIGSKGIAIILSFLSSCQNAAEVSWLQNLPWENV